MLSRLAAPVVNFLGSGAEPSTPTKGVPELLTELADVRAKKAELERREAGIVAAARARLLQEKKALEGLKKKVSDCGIEINEDWGMPAGCAVNADKQK